MRRVTVYGNRGMEFEHQLAMMHRMYQLRGLARIEKNYVPTQPVKNGQLAKVLGKAIVDFTGLMAGGRYVAFDAKDCVERRIMLERLPDHQLGYLQEVQALGGLAFVLVRLRRFDVFRVPVDAWQDAETQHRYGKMPERADGWKPKNVASLCVEDMLPEWRVNGVDWLEGVNKL